MSVCCRKLFDERSASELPPPATHREGCGIGQRAVVTLLLIYKIALSPVLSSPCKFYPTCSAYAREAIERHGVRHGLLLAVRRLLRCRPFAPGGVDPVPDRLFHDA